jgi:hypothetical protein
MTAAISGALKYCAHVSHILSEAVKYNTRAVAKLQYEIQVEEHMNPHIIFENLSTHIK